MKLLACLPPAPRSTPENVLFEEYIILLSIDSPRLRDSVKITQNTLLFGLVLAKTV